MLLVNDINIKAEIIGYGATHYKMSHLSLDGSPWIPIPEDYILHYELPNAYGIYNISIQLKNPYSVSQIIQKQVNYIEEVDLAGPTAPSNLIYSNLSSNGFDIQWEESIDNVSVSGYDIYLNSIKIDTVNELSYSFTGLEQNHEYSVYIKAFDSSGNYSENSNVITAKTLEGDISLKGNVVIVQVFSPSSTIVNTQDGVTIDSCFITLYNKSSKDIDLSLAKLYWKYDAYPSWHKVNLSGTIKANGHFLIRGSKLAGTISGTNILVNWETAKPDLDCSVDWSKFIDTNPGDVNGISDRMVEWACSFNFLYIASKTGVVYLSDGDEPIESIPYNPWLSSNENNLYVDMVGLLGKDGVNDIGETSPMTGVKKSLIYNRKKDSLNKYIDTDNNSADFEPINTLLGTSQDVSSLIKKSTT